MSRGTVAGTPGNDFMAGKVLKGAPAGSEDGAGEEGRSRRRQSGLPATPPSLPPEIRHTCAVSLSSIGLTASLILLSVAQA